MNLKQQLPNFDTIRDLGISCDGNQVTATVTKVLFSKLTELLFFIFRCTFNFNSIIKNNNTPDSNIYLWNLEKDSLGYFDFEKGLNDQDDLTLNVDNQEFQTAYEK